MLNKIQGTGQAVSKMADLKSKQDKLQKLLADIRVSGVSKNGKVTVTMTGEQKIIDITIDPALVKFVFENLISIGKPDTMMSRSIMEAVDDATSRVQAKVVEEMQRTNSMGDLMGMLQAATDMPGMQQ